MPDSCVIRIIRLELILPVSKVTTMLAAKTTHSERFEAVERDTLWITGCFHSQLRRQSVKLGTSSLLTMYQQVLVKPSNAVTLDASMLGNLCFLGGFPYIRPIMKCLSENNNTWIFCVRTSPPDSHSNTPWASYVVRHCRGAVWLEAYNLSTIRLLRLFSGPSWIVISTLKSCALFRHIRVHSMRQ